MFRIAIYIEDKDLGDVLREFKRSNIIARYDSPEYVEEYGKLTADGIIPTEAKDLKKLKKSAALHDVKKSDVGVVTLFREWLRQTKKTELRRSDITGWLTSNGRPVASAQYILNKAKEQGFLKARGRAGNKVYHVSKS